MVKVTVWGSLRPLTGGEAEVDVEATNSRELLQRLVEKHPGLESTVERGVSLAIDGAIYKEAWFTPINSDSEVVLMPLMVGG